MEWEQVSLESISCLLPEMAIICPMKTPLVLFGNSAPEQRQEFFRF